MHLTWKIVTTLGRVLDCHRAVWYEFPVSF